MKIQTRKANEQDVNRLWYLMYELAVFEKYDDNFAITPEIIIECAFNSKPSKFHCIIAETLEDQNIVGMAVYYFIPYTAQNRNVIYLKELYIEEKSRRSGIGLALMKALTAEAQINNCFQIKWNVAQWNKNGIEFYQKLGAKHNTTWLNYELNEDNFKDLLNK